MKISVKNHLQVPDVGFHHTIIMDKMQYVKENKQDYVTEQVNIIWIKVLLLQDFLITYI